LETSIRELHCRELRLPDVATEIPLNNLHFSQLYDYALSRHGEWLLCEGIRARGDGRRSISLTNLRTGSLVWNRPTLRTYNQSRMVIDDDAGVFTLQPGNTLETRLARLDDGQVIAPGMTFPAPVHALSVKRRLAARGGILYDGNSAEPLVTFANTDDVPASAAFSRDSTLLAWGSVDGSVFVCQIDTIRQRLTVMEGNRTGSGQGDADH
jgi:hypothetical protein